jgi:hypothetical protein
MVLARLLLAGALGLTMTNSASQSTPTITVGPGDTMTVQASDIQCAVLKTVPLAIVCGLVSHRALRPNSYAIRSAEVVEEIVQTSGHHQVVARSTNPVVEGAPFRTTDGHPSNFTLAKHEYVLLEGTHIVCQSGLAKNDVQTSGCGAYSISSGTSGYYVAGSFATTISDQNAAILRVGKAGAESLVAYEKQP